MSGQPLGIALGIRCDTEYLFRCGHAMVSDPINL
jgi:hypothetical protein